jgi:hydroxyethylthiazole kinase-like sugar kinase family protein
LLLVHGLISHAGNTKGVDSTASSEAALDAAKQIAKDHSCVVAVSGEVDLVRRTRVLGGVVGVGTQGEGV